MVRFRGILRGSSEESFPPEKFPRDKMSLFLTRVLIAHARFPVRFRDRFVFLKGSPKSVTDQGELEFHKFRTLILINPDCTICLRDGPPQDAGATGVELLETRILLFLPLHITAE